MLLARMENVDQAKFFADQWNGAYFRSRTVYAKLVPDCELDEILSENQKAKENPGGAFFLRPIPKEFTNQESIAKLFPGVEIHNVNFPPKGGSAIVFVNEKQAVKIIEENPHGFRAQGPNDAITELANQTSNVSISSTNTRPRNSKILDVILKVLYYKAVDSYVRTFFNRFSVARVNFPKSHNFAFVGLDSPSEQQRALEWLN
ncbi:hypothetical protein DM02DRAFT_654876 [Periconia macrospinosa]|uniref:RRM domain-containing protein n=1 Tax=Periconia macrospinosa TaxID=97972 RepID=A0A2V1DUP6_9PLEO|nr:hypothetical protein DM02DRAFT_654876 [Periconia macrospinosa]